MEPRLYMTSLTNEIRNLPRNRANEYDKLRLVAETESLVKAVRYN